MGKKSRSKKARTAELNKKPPNQRVRLARGAWFYSELRTLAHNDKLMQVVRMAEADFPDKVPCIATLYSQEAGVLLVTALPGTPAYPTFGWHYHRDNINRILLFTLSIQPSRRRMSFAEMEDHADMSSTGFRIVDKFRAQYSADTALTVVFQDGKPLWLSTNNDAGQQTMVALNEWSADERVTDIAQFKALREVRHAFARSGA